MPETVRELIGVYDADGTLVGEVRYWIGARLGRTHCGLCEITHGLFTERADWRQCRDQLDVEFPTYHRNDAPAECSPSAHPLRSWSLAPITAWTQCVAMMASCASAAASARIRNTVTRGLA